MSDLHPINNRLQSINERLLDIVERMPTLRDQFAMAALSAIMGLPVLGHADEVGADARCEMAYVYADAMLAAREKPRSK